MWGLRQLVRLKGLAFQRQIQKIIWQCNHKFDGGEKCTTPHLEEETIKQLFIKALNILGEERNLIIAGFEEIKDTAFATEGLESEAEVLTSEVNTVAELIQRCIDENARVAQDQTEYENATMLWFSGSMPRGLNWTGRRQQSPSDRHNGR